MTPFLSLQMIGWKPKGEARRIVLFVSDALPKIAGDGQVVALHFNRFFINCHVLVYEEKFVLVRGYVCVCILMYSTVCISVHVTLMLVRVSVLTR